ncbi:DUF1365 domain-containing protein [Nocardia puris]|uniref:DUF1365 family protein n=1 Tax=Nocardia puris TaxID=208602 RepID=A0A366DYC8_9NOCA|nr:DUF1365 domain-containing protein [Nocardia puris]MBF6210054.1 DUF1365 domain-containing protein [Nocardia puris]MBF6368245.1 DUF1365 domain-containing protein [Nocardia puris]MBF6458036.1 DUF1365 domain-containing protein [Nocardia puris]RBO94198.1 hypothetical protein DFR74_102621 [Nocardia puris]
MTEPALYFTRIHHARRAPVRHEFDYRGYSWYFDLAHPPKVPLLLRPLASFRAEDHLFPPSGRSRRQHGGGRPDDLRARVDAVLAAHGIHDAGGPVTALMNARVFGYVFDPLTVFWCHDRRGDLRCVVAEVHNTYGQRHAYVVQPDKRGRAEIDKAFHVSPFHRVEGRYRLRLPEPADALDLRITLLRDAQPPFHAALTGHRLPVTARTVLRANLRAPLSPLLTSARIRRHGIALWARGLPITPRPRAESPLRTAP